MKKVNVGRYQDYNQDEVTFSFSCILKRAGFLFPGMVGSLGDQELFVVYFRKKPFISWSSGRFFLIGISAVVSSWSFAFLLKCTSYHQSYTTPKI